MLVKELFEKNNIPCPNWLEKKTINDELINSEYVFEDNTHKWLLKKYGRLTVITFNGKEYRYKAYKNGVLGYEYYSDGNHVFTS